MKASRGYEAHSLSGRLGPIPALHTVWLWVKSFMVLILAASVESIHCMVYLKRLKRNKYFWSETPGPTSSQVWKDSDACQGSWLSPWSQRAAEREPSNSLESYSVQGAGGKCREWHEDHSGVPYSSSLPAHSFSSECVVSFYIIFVPLRFGAKTELWRYTRFWFETRGCQQLCCKWPDS